MANIKCEADLDHPCDCPECEAEYRKQARLYVGGDTNPYLAIPEDFVRPEPKKKQK